MIQAFFGTGEFSHLGLGSPFIWKGGIVLCDETIVFRIDDLKV